MVQLELTSNLLLEARQCVRPERAMVQGLSCGTEVLLQQVLEKASLLRPQGLIAQ